MTKPRSRTRYKISLPLATVIAVLLASLVYQRYGHPLARTQPLEDARLETVREEAIYQWSYSSEAEYQGTDARPMRVDCRASGEWRVQGSDRDSRLTIESFRCNDQLIAQLSNYHFVAKTLLALPPKELTEASPINALALTLAREVELGVPEVPQGNARLVYEEERLEGSIPRSVSVTQKNGIPYWTKTFDGVLPARTGLRHTLKATTHGISRPQSEATSGIEELHAKETEIVTLGKRPLSKSTVALEIKRLSSSARGPKPKDRGALLPLAAKAADPEQDRRELLTEWTAFLTAPKEKKPEKTASDRLYVRLKLAFRHDPPFAKEFRHSLETLSPDSEEFKLLLGALAYAGSETATNVLSESAMAKSEDAQWQVALTPVFGLLNRPTPASWEYLETIRLKALDPDVRKAAELALAGEYRQGLHDEKAKSFVNEVLNRDEKDKNSIYGKLDVIGNAALEEEVSRVAAWASRPEPELRAACAESLRLMKSPASEQLLLHILKDVAIEVRRSAAQAFQTRTLSVQAIPELLHRLTLSENRDDFIQASFLEALYSAREIDPDLLSKLKAARAQTRMSPAIAERWDGLERDWL